MHASSAAAKWRDGTATATIVAPSSAAGASGTGSTPSSSATPGR